MAGAGAPLHLPVLRWGAPYRSLDRVRLADVRSGAPVVEVSQANPGLVVRDLGRAAAAQASLGRLATAERLAIARRAADLFAHGDLPVGDETQSSERYLEQLAATAGMPIALGRRNLEKVRGVLAGLDAVLAGLTRGLDLAVLDAGYGDLPSGRVSFRREADALGLVLPSNSPGVHALWLPALALGVAVAIKPGRQEPWTPYRLAQAFVAAGAPPEAFGFYPGDHAAASELLLRCGRSLLFGDAGTVAPWRGDPRIEIHGPGWSKVVFGADAAAGWRDHLDVLVASVAENGGRSCINASGIRTPAHGRALAEALAERLAAIEARPLDDPSAALAAFPSRAAADRLSAAIDRQLAAGGAEDLTARHRSSPGGRVAEVDGCAFLLPTVVWCEDAGHPLAQAECAGDPRTTIVAWRPDGTVETDDVGRLAKLASDPAVRLWVDAVLPDAETVRAISDALGLHHLIAEDIAERNQRAKVETFDGIVHIVLFGLAYLGEVRTAEIDFVLSERAVVSVHGPEWDARTVAPLRMGVEPLLARGADYLLYALADAIVDGYFPVLDRLADEIDQLQDDVMASASDWELQRLFVLKRELLDIRRATSPAREVFNQLTNRELGPIQEAHVVYFRDVYDHLIRVTDELDNYRELVAGTLDIYLSIVNNNLSRIMKRLTGVTVILAGIGAIAGIFGMSEAGAAFAGGEAVGFWLVTGATIALAATAAVVLRRFDWI